MAKICEVHTVITQVSEDGLKKPESPLFKFVNDGTFDCFIENFLVRPGETFGIDADTLVSTLLLQGIPVKNTTQYKIRFVTVAGGGRASLQLIETNVKLVG